MPSTADIEVLKLLKKAFARHIPSGHTIAAAAVRNAIAGHENDPGWIKSNFSILVESVQIAAYETYLEVEKRIGQAALSEVFLPLLSEHATASDALRIVGENFYALDKFFLGLTQGRRPRAGAAFELLIREAFKLLGYPYTAQAVIDGQPDFILPSVEHYRSNPMDAIIFTVKRTLRERWRQIVTEGTRGLGFYLATIDEGVSQKDLNDMLATRIYLVVPHRIKMECYPTVANVIAFEHFFQYYLDPAMERWRAAGVPGVTG